MSLRTPARRRSPISASRNVCPCMLPWLSPTATSWWVVKASAIAAIGSRGVAGWGADWALSTAHADAQIDAITRAKHLDVFTHHLLHVGHGPRRSMLLRSESEAGKDCCEEASRGCR